MICLCEDDHHKEHFLKTLEQKAVENFLLGSSNVFGDADLLAKAQKYVPRPETKKKAKDDKEDKKEDKKEGKDDKEDKKDKKDTAGKGSKEDATGGGSSGARCGGGGNDGKEGAKNEKVVVPSERTTEWEYRVGLCGWGPRGSPLGMGFGGEGLVSVMGL